MSIAPLTQPVSANNSLNNVRVPHLRVVPDSTITNEARGFALYAGIDEAQAAAAGTSLSEIAQALKATIENLIPGAASETYAAVALAPAGTGGRNLDVVRLALSEPRAKSALGVDSKIGSEGDRPGTGVVIDLTRAKVFVDGQNINLTYREYSILRFIVEQPSVNISRQDLVDGVWTESDEVPNERSIDVHIRRLRAKLGFYEDIVRTVRGVGYRFDEHPDVLVEV